MSGISDDRLQSGRIIFRQPARGYRTGIDPVFLAAAVPAMPGDLILDAGAGTGAASLCLAARVAGCRVIGLEIQPELQQIGSANAQEEASRTTLVGLGAGSRTTILRGDLFQPPFARDAFDHVMTNPPHLDASRTSPPPDPVRARAHIEQGFHIEQWMYASIDLLRRGGTLSVIHRADRLDQLLCALRRHLGGLVVYPLWPKPDSADARRIVVQGKKGSNEPLRLRRGLVLHRMDGGYTVEADAILRTLAELPIGRRS